MLPSLVTLFACSIFLGGEKVAKWNFDDAKVGAPPASWEFASTNPGKKVARWEIARDDTAPSRPNVLRLAETKNTDSTYNVAMLGGTSYKDVDLSVMIQPLTGEEDQGGGLIWRCRDEKNYYICRINPLEENYRVYKVVDSKRTMLKSVKAPTPAHHWYTLRVVMRGDEMTCYLDGKPLLEAKDDTFKAAGRIGLWTKADAASSFDDLTATELTQ